MRHRARADTDRQTGGEIHRPFFHSHSHTGTSSSPPGGALGRCAARSIDRQPSAPRPSSPPRYATPSIPCVRNAHMPVSPGNPLPATPRERSHPQRVALSQRPSAESSRPPPRSAQLRRQGCQVVKVSIQHWMVRSARVLAARQRVWRLSTSVSAPVLSMLLRLIVQLLMMPCSRVFAMLAWRPGRVLKGQLSSTPFCRGLCCPRSEACADRFALLAGT